MKTEIDKIIEDNYKVFIHYATQICKNKDTAYEVVHDAILYIYNLDENKQTAIISFLKLYILKIIKYSLKSKTSPYQQKRKMFVELKPEHLESVIDDDISERIDTEIFEDMTIRKIKEILAEKTTWYERQIFMEYIDRNLSFSKFSKETNICQSSLFHTYNKVKQIIKNNIDHGQNTKRNE